ncbi:MAG: glycosyltransferase [Acidobacteriota bacterium]
MNLSTPSTTSDHEPTPPTIRGRGRRVLFPVLRAADFDGMLFLAKLLARGAEGAEPGELVIAHLMSTSDGASLASETARASTIRRELEQALERRGTAPTTVRSVVRVERQAWEGVFDLIEDEEIDLLILAWDHLQQAEVDDLIDRRLASPPCDVVLARPGQALVDGASWRDLERLLVPLRQGPHAHLALDLASAVATAADANITCVHVRESEQAHDQLAELEPALRRTPRLERQLVIDGDAVDAIVGEACGHDLLVLGAATRGRPSQHWKGTVLSAVAGACDATLLVAKRRGGPPVDTLAESLDGETAPIARVPRRRSLAEQIDKWIADNTFHCDEFDEVEKLVALKRRQNLRISLAVPALNEERHIGALVRTCRHALVDNFPLLDQILVLDGGSTDATRDEAAAAGAEVAEQSQILPEHGNGGHGRGEALWKSLHAASGDLVAWLDVGDVHPRHVTGVLGPLLKHPRLALVLGFARQHSTNGPTPSVDAHLVDLVVRPLFDLFYPRLSGIVQPLATEWAGRRSALESIPFSSGQGVEVGLLIDLLERHGLSAIAQCDLRDPVHRDRPAPSATKRAHAALQAVLKRLSRRHDIDLLAASDLAMSTLRHTELGYRLDRAGVEERELPSSTAKGGLSAQGKCLQ